MSIRTRIAPSPTGPLHVGTARTALFNYLYAKKQGGAFILRIEDTDLERSDPKYEQEIMASLKWLGIEWDEGPASETTNYQLPTTNYIGNYGPYRQSERLETYKSNLEKLLEKGDAFYCFHTEQELEKEREGQLSEKKPPIHVCEYRDSTRDKSESLLKEKPEHIVRFRTPFGKKIVFDDLIRGQISFEADLLGDFSLAKDLNVPLYNFAVVVDDFEMQISHVVRGEDHIPNTPKQILIQESLGLPRPGYAHLPLILGQDRSKLSKRHGAASVSEYREAGYLPEVIVNFMALLGWNPGTDEEIFSLQELVDSFDFTKVQKSGAVFNIEKLDWLNGEYIRKKSVFELTELCKPYLTDFLKFSIPNDQFPNEYIEKVVALEQPRLKKLSEIGERTEYFFRMPIYDKELLRWKNMNDKDILQSIDKSIEILPNIIFPNVHDSKRSHKIMNISKEHLNEIFFQEIGEGDKGKILWPLRVALAGKKSSPGPFEIMEILGVEESKKRLKAAKEKLRGLAS